MTNEELIAEIIHLYKIAKKSTEKYVLTQVKRGRNHSISSQTEDLLAYFIYQRCAAQEIEMWVDYPISYKTSSKVTKRGNAGTKTIYPDISLVRKTKTGEDEIFEMIDLKMDLGWKRELKPYLDQKQNLINEIRAIKKATYKKINAEGYKSKEQSNVLISDKLMWRVPVISDQNIEPGQMKENRSYCDGEPLNSVLKLYVFSSEFHPNSGKATTTNLEIEEFIADITNSINLHHVNPKT